MKTVTVKLPPELDNKVDRLAARLKQTKSGVIRLALQDLLSRPDMAARISAFGLAEPYCGALEGLPPDLSYGKRHLDGYGGK